MRKKLITLALMLAFTTPGIAAGSDSPGPFPGGSCQSCGESEAAKEAAEALRASFANYNFQDVRETPITGIFEVVADQNILYFAPASGHLIFGEIWDKNGTNLTTKSRDQQAAKVIDTLPLEKAITVGNGPTKVIEFSNPDCGYCRRASAFFADRTDVTRHIFLVDFGNGDTSAKNSFILAADDPAAAYEAVMAGKFDNGRPVPNATESARRMLADHQRIVAAMGVKGTPYFWINGTQVRGANIPEIEKLLASAQAAPDRSTDVQTKQEDM